MSNQYFDPIDILGPDFFLNDVKTVRNLVKQRIVVCLFTEPGELWDSEFGVGLRHILFEQNTPTLQSQVVQRIEKQMSRYFPYVQLQNVIPMPVEEDPNLLGIRMEIYIPYLQESLVLQYGQGQNQGTGPTEFDAGAFGLTDQANTTSDEARFYTESGILGITEQNYSWDPND